MADRPALWSRRRGTWLPTSWRQYARNVKSFALGLIDTGLRPQDVVAIIASNREEWVVAALAVSASGGIPVGLPANASPDVLSSLIRHCEARLLVVEEAQTLKRLSERPKAEAARLMAIVMDAPDALPPNVLRFSELIDRGSTLPEGPYFERVESLRPEGVSTLIYAEQTPPLGVMLSHRNSCWTAATVIDAAGLGEDEIFLSSLPLSDIAEWTCSVGMAIAAGAQVYFSDSTQSFAENVRRVRPTALFAVPSMWNELQHEFEHAVAKRTLRDQQLVAWARQLALRFHRLTIDHRQPSLRLAAAYALGRKLVLDSFKASMGLDRCHYAATTGGPVLLGLLRFFAAFDIILREMYGLPEVSGPVSVSTKEHTRLGAVGRPMPGVSVRIASDGEILVKGENVCAGYLKSPELNGRLIREGWLATGDFGALDAEGFLHLQDRPK
jgi:long-chain acyl-CoA synthetase